MIEIDGSFGEGGGQILRSSLALSMVTGLPVRIYNIRAGRAKPGLARQHLTALTAAVTVSSATVHGDAVGSTEVVFEPGDVGGGNYSFDIGSAGSTTLVLQTILLPLTLAERRSQITLAGGTHNPHAPPFDFLAKAFLPLINRMGPQVRARMERHGFYPAGGGRLVVDIEPAEAFRGFELLERGALQRRHGRACVARLPATIGEREIGVIRKRLGWDATELVVESIDTSRGPGNVVMLTLQYEHVTEVFTSFGEIRRSAERVASDAASACERYLQSTAPVGEHLTDQLMLPLATAGAGSFVSTGLSRHSETHVELIQRFLDVSILAEPTRGEATLVSIVTHSRRSAAR